MATTTDNDSAVSGGLLVILGIIVALGIGYAFYHYRGVSSAPDMNINVSGPAATPSTPTPGPVTTPTPAAAE